MHLTPETRPSLLLRLRNPQDERAWSEFVEIYEPLIESLARRSGLQHADARELVQDVLVAVARAIDGWNPDPARGSFRGWLFRIARNLMVNLLKREGRQIRATGDSELRRLLNEQPDPTCGDTALFDLEYRRRMFRWAAERIRNEFQESTWEAFRLTCVDGLEIDAVAMQLGMSRGAVYVARSRVMARLKNHIEKIEHE